MKQCKDSDIYIGWTTVTSNQDAQVLCNKLVQKGLVACAQISQPIQSIYQWNGEVKTEKEFKITLKFTAEKVEEVTKEIVDLHPYDLPQWVYLKVDSNSEYAEWVWAQTQ
jgi:periplasmic divalent cation tolerance protein